MRVRARTDSNQREIVTALRELGCNVLDLSRVGSGCPDLLVSRGARLVLLEVKTAKGKSTADQAHFEAQGWPVSIVRSVSEALIAVGLFGNQRAADVEGVAV